MLVFNIPVALSHLAGVQTSWYGQKLSSLNTQQDDDCGSDGTTASSQQPPVPKYFTLHARIEPDMQHHIVCNDRKEKNLTKLFQMLEQTFPIPPADYMFLPINRQMLEKEGFVNTRNINKTNWIAVENLKTLNYVMEYGLWNGTVKIFEFGANALQGTKYESRPSTTGALINYYIALNSTLFIGTELSSYSYDLVFTRFYNNKSSRNYKVRLSKVQ